MASTFSYDRRWPARSRQSFLISGLVAAALLAIAGVTSLTPAVTNAVRGFQAEIVPPAGDLPPIPAAAYVVVDGDTGEPLASANADQRRPVASLVKLMTARLVLDAGRLERTATIPPLQIAGDESQAGLETGDRVSRGELLRAMLVASANDAARTLAVDVAGNEPSFVRMMNAEAAASNLDATRYANSTGLDHPAQRSSAADVARLARDLMDNPVFRQIVAAESTTLQGSALPTTNDLLRTYPRADGIKTGHTDEAGWCIAASATRGGRSIVAVVLGAPTEQARDDAARTLLDYGFQQTATERSHARPVLERDMSRSRAGFGTGGNPLYAIGLPGAAGGGRRPGRPRPAPSSRRLGRAGDEPAAATRLPGPSGHRVDGRAGPAG